MAGPAPRPRSPFWLAFGPGLLWASAAIGVSHLVQSTRAGADAGLGLAWVILAALVFKYPFFEYGPRYAAATGESLVEGYLRVGRWALWLYLLITVSTALVIQVAVVLFTAFVTRHVFGLDWSLPVVTAAVVGACAGLLLLGRFRGLDRAAKVIITLLAVSTLFAAAVAVKRVDTATLAPWPLGPDPIAFPFILALVGWMPSAFDISVWSSLWTLAKNRDTGARASVTHAVLDFRIGYVGTGILAFAFVLLGAGVMHGSGASFSEQGTQFSIQLVDLYASTLGGWLRPVVLVAMFTTMFSTSLTVIDGFPRAIARTVHVVRRGLDATPNDESPVYWGAGAVLGGLTVLVVAAFIGSLTAMVDFATTVSFCTAPALGYVNLRAVTAPHVPPEHRPGKVLRAVSYLGLAVLGGTAVVYLITVFG